MVLDCHKNPDELVTVEDVSVLMDNCCDCLLIRTGFGKYHDIDTETYVSKNPGISPEAINCLRGNLPNLACLGIDTVSMSRYGRKEEAIEVHQNAFNMVEGFGKPLLLVEDLDLKPLEGKLELENVLIIPWQVGGIDSAPCTVLATVNQSTK
jgi:kynurenine formamidase